MPIWLLAMAWLIIIMTAPALFLRPITRKELREDLSLRVILVVNFIAILILIIHLLVGFFQ